MTDENARDYAAATVGAAQAAAGDIKDALKTADEVSKSQRVNVLRPVAVAQAEAGRVQEAEQTMVMIENDYERALTLLTLVKAHLKAKARDAARKNLLDAVRIVQGLNEGGDAMPWAHHYVAEAQAELGDVKDARQTADAIAHERLKKMALGKIVAVQSKTGDIKGALQTAESLQDEQQKRDVLAYSILPAQLRSGDVKAGQQTAEVLKGDYRHVLALGEIAKAQAQAGDRAAAADTFKKAFEMVGQLADAEPTLGGLSARNAALCRIVGQQAEAGEEGAAFDWALKQSSPLVRASALLHIARGMALRKESEKKPRE
jgi:tetratricopeptide (TPR) repeat protein